MTVEKGEGQRKKWLFCGVAVLGRMYRHPAMWGKDGYFSWGRKAK